VGFQPNVERCNGCYGPGIDGEEDPEYDGHRSYDCPLMWHLVERGCIHRFRNQWYQGLLRPGVEAKLIFFSRDRRMFDQARAIVHGGEFDYNVEARPANRRRMEEDARLAALDGLWMRDGENHLIEGLSEPPIYTAIGTPQFMLQLSGFRRATYTYLNVTIVYGRKSGAKTRSGDEAPPLPVTGSGYRGTKGRLIPVVYQGLP
jgi:hypothetical protein